MSGVSYSYDFRIVSYPTRIYSGLDALDQLPAEVGRHMQRSKEAVAVDLLQLRAEAPFAVRGAHGHNARCHGGSV